MPPKFVTISQDDGPRADTTMDESVDHHVVGKNIQLLLVVSSTVDFSSQTVQLGNTSTLHGRRNELARRGNGIEQNHKIVIMRVGHDKAAQGFGILGKRAAGRVGGREGGREADRWLEVRQVRRP